MNQIIDSFVQKALAVYLPIHLANHARGQTLAFAQANM